MGYIILVAVTVQCVKHYDRSFISSTLKCKEREQGRYDDDISQVHKF